MTVDHGLCRNTHCIHHRRRGTREWCGKPDCYPNIDRTNGCGGGACRSFRPRSAKHSEQATLKVGP